MLLACVALIFLGLMRRSIGHDHGTHTRSDVPFFSDNDLAVFQNVALDRSGCTDTLASI